MNKGSTFLPEKKDYNNTIFITIWIAWADHLQVVKFRNEKSPCLQHLCMLNPSRFVYKIIASSFVVVRTNRRKTIRFISGIATQTPYRDADQKHSAYSIAYLERPFGYNIRRIHGRNRDIGFIVVRKPNSAKAMQFHFVAIRGACSGKQITVECEQ